jgi:hypothetical protein
MNSYNGLLLQLSSISLIATELFDEILTNSKKTFDRISSISQRVSRIKEKIPEIESYVEKNSNNFYQNSSMIISEEKIQTIFHKKDENIINRRNTPIAIELQYNSCSEIPDFSLLNEYHTSGNCSKDYSFPGYFIQEWAQEELAKQKKGIYLK